MENITREDFKQLYYIDLEIKRHELKIEEHETRGTHCTQNYQNLDMPRGSGTSSIVEESSIDAMEVKTVIEGILQRRNQEKARLIKLIEEVGKDDAEMRLILSFRYVDGLSWEDVGKAMGSTSEAVRSKDKRFFQKLESDTARPVT